MSEKDLDYNNFYFNAKATGSHTWIDGWMDGI